jgi:hypothetical protein
MQVFAQKIYKGNLGNNMTLCIYVCFTVCCIGAPAAVNKLGARLAMFVGILGYASVVAAGLVYFKTGSDATVYACACLLGAGGGLLWIGQGRLILDYTNDTNRGMCFSLFWAMYRAAALLGGIVSFLYFSAEGDAAASDGLYLIFLALVIVGATTVLTLRHPSQVRGSSAQVDALLPPSWLHEAKQTLAMFLNADMLLLAPMFWASGCNEPYILSTFGRHFTKSTLGIEMVFFYGGCIVGALGCGRILDRVSHRATPATSGLLVLALFTLIHFTAFALAAQAEHVWDGTPVDLGPKSALPSAVFCLWGLSDAMINTFLYWLVGALYREDGPSKAYACGTDNRGNRKRISC